MTTKELPVSEEEPECKTIIDHLHTDNPTWGARQMSAQLKLRGYQVGRRKASRYMREMDITPIYPKMNLNLDFADIAAQLNGIVEEYFGL